MNEIIGWFDSPEQTEAVFDPMFDADCPYCGGKMNLEDVRTHSIMGAADGTKSYFYRTHRTCDTDASDHEKQLIFEGVARQVEEREGFGI